VCMTRDLLTLVANFKPGMQVGGLNSSCTFQARLLGLGKTLGIRGAAAILEIELETNAVQL